MLRQYRTATLSANELGPLNSPYSTDAEFKRALAAAVGAQRAGLGDEPVYSPLHGVAKLGTALAGAFLENSASEAQKRQNAVLLADALGAIGETPTIGGTTSTPSGGSKSTPDNVADYTANVANASPWMGLLGKAEGTAKGRGYDETLDYGKYTGGPVNLRGMRVSEVRNLQRGILNHPDNPHNSSAVGLPQIVGRTLDGLIAKGVVKPDELFNEEVQDRAALHLAEARGRNPAALRQEWAGLKNVPDEQILAAYDATFGANRARDAGTQPGRTPTERVQLASSDPTFVPVPPTRPADLGAAIAGAPVAPTTSSGRLNALTGGRAGEPDLGQDVATGAATVLPRSPSLTETETTTASTRGSGMGAATAMANPSVRPAIDPRLMNLYLYGDERGRAIAAQLIQRNSNPSYQYENVNGVGLVAVNPRNPADTRVVAPVARSRQFQQIERDGEKIPGTFDPDSGTWTPLPGQQAPARPSDPDKPAGVSDAAWRKAKEERAIREATPPDDKAVDEFRSKYEAQKPLQTYRQVRPVWDSLLKSAETDTKAADLDLVYGTAKLLDPDSVVREGEQIMFKRTDGIFGQLAGQLESLKGNAALGKEARLGLLDIARNRISGMHEAARAVDTFYRDEAVNRRINPKRLGPEIGDLPMPDPDKINTRRPAGMGPAAPEGPPAPAVTVPSVREDGLPRKIVNGKTYVRRGNDWFLE